MPRTTISTAENGYIVEREKPEGKGEFDTIESVFENQDETLEGELKAFQRAVYAIAESFDLLGSKHDTHRIKISVVNQQTGEEE